MADDDKALGRCPGGALLHQSGARGFGPAVCPADFGKSRADRRGGLSPEWAGGFRLVSLYGPVLEALGDAMPLDQSLILLRVNAEYLDELLQTHRPETVAGHLRHVAAAGLTEAVGGSPNACDFAGRARRAVSEAALRQAGPDAADVVFGDFATDPCAARRSPPCGARLMALAMLDKYAADPDFREVLRTHGAAVIPPIAQADAGPETLAFLEAKTRRSFTESLALAAVFAAGDNGQAMIRTIKNDGLARVAQLNQSEVRFYQFLPLYDVIHLGNVLGRGHAPTSSEMTWALVDGCFVIADVLSLAAVQPEGALAAEAVRAEVKAAVREGARSVGRELAESGAESTGKAICAGTRSGPVWRAGGAVPRCRNGAGAMVDRALGRRLVPGPPAISRGTAAAQPHPDGRMAGPAPRKAGMRLSAWRPIRLLHDGTEVVLRIPPATRLEIPSASGRPGRRRRGRLSQDGRAPGARTAHPPLD